VRQVIGTMVPASFQPLSSNGPTNSREPGRLRLVVESELAETDCPSGGVICTTLRAASPWTHSSTALEVGEQPAD
jgi:hypothetical protein